MRDELISLDFAIKYIFRSQADKGIIEGFLSALLATANYKPVTIVRFLDSESNKDDPKGKKVLADLVVEDSDGVQYIIEFERSQKYNFMHKACFSNSRMVVDSISQGEDFKKITKVIHISVLYFDIGSGVSIYHGTTIVRDTAKGYTIDLYLKSKDGVEYDVGDIFPEYFIISIPAFDNQINRGIDEWLYLLKNQTIKEDFKEKDIRHALRRLHFLQLSGKNQAKYMRYQGEIADREEEIRVAEINGRVDGEAKGRKKGMKDGIKKGRKEGREAGIAEERQKIINSMMAQGMKKTTIAKILGINIL